VVLARLALGLLLLFPLHTRAITDWPLACQQPPPPGLAAPAQDKRLVLIIDDMGNRLAAGREVIALPGKLTIAVLPFTPHGAQLAQAAHRAGKEVMLHAPMSNLGQIPLGQGGLTAGQTEQEFKDTLRGALDQLPHLRGMNNHMGSDLTQRQQQMQWVMDILRERDLYFIDSRTSAMTVAAQTAASNAVPHLSRKVFLDNERHPDAIQAAFGRLLGAVEASGLAVGIGHPYPETIAFLNQALPKLQCRGVRLSLVSEALDVSTQNPSVVPANPSEPDLYAPLGHIGLGLGYGVLSEVKDTGGQHRVGPADKNPLDQVIERTHSP
jgi:polysaccharide deacetylase 2 family uncharacterized protein YibQ